MGILARSLLGVGLWAILVVRYRNLYLGSQMFYLRAQRGSAAACALLDGPLGRVARDWGIYSESAERERMSEIVIAQYSDASLSGYADEDYSKGGDSVGEQQRGLILPLLSRALAELAPGAQVVEIGTGNGDVAAHLAGAHPQLRFVGVDFSVAVATRKHAGLGNLSFVEGYALDLLESGELTGALAFASSTWIVFTPRELAAYVRTLRAADFTEVVLNEPTWAGHVQRPGDAAESWHLEGATWHHAYAGYLRECGYEPAEFSFEHYAHPVSERPDIHVLLLRARAAR